MSYPSSANAQDARRPRTRSPNGPPQANLNARDTNRPPFSLADYSGNDVVGIAATVPEPAFSDDGSSDPKSKAPQHLNRSREALANDPFRPLYHLSSPGERLWDPGGFCEWKGKYHLFYISARGGKGHAVSDDLVHWRDLPPLPQLAGMTGQMITTKDKALMTFNSGKRGVQLATASDPLLLKWEVRAALPPSVLKGYQQPIDSCIWEDDGEFFMGVRKHRWDQGFYHLRGDKPELTVFRSSSKDLKNWEYDGVLIREDGYTQPGDDFACANFLPMGHNRRLLLWFNHPRGAMYLIGTYNREKEEQKFVTEYHGRMSYGSVKLGTLHAPSAFLDSQQRCFAIFNVSENRPHRGWEGTMSLPRQISLNRDYLANHTAKNPRSMRNFFSPLRIEPPAALDKLRFSPVKVGAMDIAANSETVISEVKGKSIEIEAVIDPKNAREVGLRILRSPDGREQTTIRFYMQGWERNINARALSIDVSESSLSPEVQARTPETGLLYLEKGEPLRLRVFVDRSIIEVFANDRQCLTIRAYPTRKDSSQVSVLARGSEAKLVSLRAWQMSSIWPELKDQEDD